MKKKILFASALLMATIAAVGQTSTPDYMNPVITAMPALNIAPDARAAGLGDIGASTAPDINSQRWNPAKYAYMESRGGIVGNYTPWLRKLVGDIDLAYLSGYFKWDDVQGIGASFTYFSYGEVFIQQAGAAEPDLSQSVRPNEWSLDLSYYRKLHEYVSMAVALRFLYSDINNGHNQSTGTPSSELYPAWTMAADIALYYKQPIDVPMGTSYFNLGFGLNNLGGKMTWDKVHYNYIPVNFRIGATYELPCDKYNFLSFSVEATKLMVPTKYYSNLGPHFDPNNKETWTLTEDEYNNLPYVKSLFQSFCDAPSEKGKYNVKEEFNEVIWGAGIEYTYNHQFFARVGYSYEHPTKGNRRLFEVGAGFHLSIVNFDVSYTITTASTNPLNNTMRFTLGFDLAGIKDLVNNRR